MEQIEKESDNIELRSEKVRNVIGKVPPRLVSLGTVVITTEALAIDIIVVVFAIAYALIGALQDFAHDAAALGAGIGTVVDA